MPVPVSLRVRPRALASLSQVRMVYCIVAFLLGLLQGLFGLLFLWVLTRLLCRCLEFAPFLFLRRVRELPWIVKL